MRVCPLHDWPYGTLGCWYAVTELPWRTVEPLKVQFNAGSTEHELYAYEPESELLEHVLVCETQELPYGTVDAW